MFDPQVGDLVPYYTYEGGFYLVRIETISTVEGDRFPYRGKMPRRSGCSEFAASRSYLSTCWDRFLSVVGDADV